MNDNIEVFSSAEFKDIIQDLRELFSQHRLAFLIGAGCSFKAGLPLMPALTKEVLCDEHLCDKTKSCLKKIETLFSGSKEPTIEDYMSELVDYLSIAVRRKQLGAKQCKIGVVDEEFSESDLTSVLDEIQKRVAQIINKKDIDVSCHQQFVRAIHNSLQAGKTHRVVNYFILNYDTLLEDALGLEKLSYADGFDGAATGWWEPTTFQKNGKAARVFKLHGSIDWCLLNGDFLPRRIRSGIKTNMSRKHVFVYPAATKYLEMQRDPFAFLLQQMRDVLSPERNREIVLAICGYSFGDSHINVEIEKALYQSEGQMTVAAFISDDTPQKIVKKWLDDSNISEQIRVYSKKGFFHSDTVKETDDELSWWKFEVLARLLGGEK